VCRIFKLREGPAYLRFLVAITSPDGRKVSESGDMNGLMVHILQVKTIVGLDGINAVNFKHILTKRIPSPEGMGWHADSSVTMDLFQYLEEI